MMLQMLEMQNDVNRGSAKIVELKQETAGLRSQLSRATARARRRRAHAPPAETAAAVFDGAALRRTCDDLERHAQKAF